MRSISQSVSSGWSPIGGLDFTDFIFLKEIPWTGFHRYRVWKSTRVVSPCQLLLQGESSFYHVTLVTQPFD